MRKDGDNEKGGRELTVRVSAVVKGPRASKSVVLFPVTSLGHALSAWHFMDS